MRCQILLVEDERAIADNIVYALEAEGYSVHWASLGRRGLEILQQQQIELVILDVGLPDISGFELCKTIRQSGDTPIIFLTARDAEIDRVVGLEIGADDYVVKPFSPRELAARVKAILRRTGNDALADVETPNFNVDTQKRSVSYRGVELDLTRYEFGILCLLIEHPGRVYSRTQLMNRVWPSPEESFERAVDTHIKTIRAKLRAIYADDDSLVTHRGVGYSLRVGGE